MIPRSNCHRLLISVNMLTAAISGIQVKQHVMTKLKHDVVEHFQLYQILSQQCRTLINNSAEIKAFFKNSLIISHYVCVVIL